MEYVVAAREYMLGRIEPKHEVKKKKSDKGKSGSKKKPQARSGTKSTAAVKPIEENDEDKTVLAKTKLTTNEPTKNADLEEDEGEGEFIVFANLDSDKATHLICSFEEMIHTEAAISIKNWERILFDVTKASPEAAGKYLKEEGSLPKLSVKQRNILMIQFYRLNLGKAPKVTQVKDDNEFYISAKLGEGGATKLIEMYGSKAHSEQAIVVDHAWEEVRIDVRNISSEAAGMYLAKKDELPKLTVKQNNIIMFNSFKPAKEDKGDK